MRRITLGSLVKRGLLALALAIPLLMSSPHRASAWLCCSPVFSDPVAESETTATAVSQTATAVAQVAGWAARAAQYLQEIAQWAIDNLDSVLSNLTSVLSEQINAMTTMVAAQANVDSLNRETTKQNVADITLDYAPNLPSAAAPPPGQISTGYNACADSTNSMVITGNAIEDLSRALAFFTQESKLGSNDNVLLKRLEEQCFRGLRTPGLAPAPCPDLSAAAMGYGYADTDTDVNTILAPPDLYYTLPATTSINATTGQLELPYMQPPPWNPGAATVTVTNEMNFIAAMMACRNFTPSIAAPPNPSTAANNSLGDAGAIADYVKRLAGASGITEDCVREVARRTRVPQLAAQNDVNGGVLEEVYQAQIQRCQQQNDLGIYNPGFSDSATDLNDCLANGRSEMEMDRNDACKLSSGTNYNATTLASSGQTVNENIMTLVDHSNDCMDFYNKLQDDNNDISMRFMANVRQREALNAQTGSAGRN